MNELKYDPRTKQQIKDLLYAFLYQPVQDKYQHKLAAIITKNSQLLGSSFDSFIYRGEVYKANEKSKLPRRMNRLHKSLEPEMQAYLEDVNRLNGYELPYVLGFINQVLNSSDDLQDYLKVLPESVHQPLMDLMATCECRTARLTDEVITDIQAKNSVPIDLMKQRQMLNLLL